MDVEEQAVARRAPKISRWGVAAIASAATALLIGAYLFASSTMWWQDPAGSRACAMLSDSIDPGTGKINGSLKNSTAIAEQAKDSSTAAIRATVREHPELADVGSAILADLDRLHAACVQAGRDMPPISG